MWRSTVAVALWVKPHFIFFFSGQKSVTCGSPFTFRSVSCSCSCRQQKCDVEGKRESAAGWGPPLFPSPLFDFCFHSWLGLLFVSHRRETESPGKRRRRHPDWGWCRVCTRKGWNEDAMRGKGQWKDSRDWRLLCTDHTWNDLTQLAEEGINRVCLTCFAAALLGLFPPSAPHINNVIHMLKTSELPNSGDLVQVLGNLGEILRCPAFQRKYPLVKTKVFCCCSPKDKTDSLCVVFPVTKNVI